MVKFNPEKLKKAMKKKNMDAQDLRNQIYLKKKKKVGERTISYWLKGFCEPRSSYLKVLSDILSKKMEYFFEETNERR